MDSVSSPNIISKINKVIIFVTEKAYKCSQIS